MIANKITGYSYDPIGNTLTITNAFAKKASQLNTAEYNIMKQFRRDNPSLTIVKAEKKAPSNRPLNVKFAEMEKFIAQCRGKEARLAEFEKVKVLSKIQSSPYAYVKTWFLEHYANYSAQPEFDSDGFVIVKTKQEMEAEVEAQEQSGEAMAQDKAAA